jgi:hypothetical protein
MTMFGLSAASSATNDVARKTASIGRMLRFIFKIIVNSQPLFKIPSLLAAQAGLTLSQCHGLTSELNDSRRQRRLSERGAFEWLPGLEEKRSAAVRFNSLIEQTHASGSAFQGAFSLLGGGLRR